MAKRRAVSKRIRFEVFKRDSFKCQYCGRSAPDVTLELEHVLPVAKGGQNDIMNLLTSCVDCNSGKADVLLDDASAVAKQKKQADELNERRLQLQMMMEWKSELLNIDADILKQVDAYWWKLTGHSFTEVGRENMRKVIKRFGLQEVLECIDIATAKYPDPNVAFDKVGAIAYVRQKSKSDPAYQPLSIIRGILKQRGFYINHTALESGIREAIDRGCDSEALIAWAKNARNWTQFIGHIQDESGE